MERAQRGPRKLLVLANSGAGKSFLLARCFLDQLAAYCTAPAAATGTVPVFFPLSRFTSGRESLIDQLREWLFARGYHQAEETFAAEVQAGKFSFFLDALDEMKVGIGVEIDELLEPIASLLEWPNVDVIVSGRLGLLGAQLPSLLRNFDVLELHEWEHTNWTTFLEQYVATGHLQHGEANALSSLEGPVRTLTTKPLYCKMIVQEREHVLGNEIRNVADLFRRYVERFWTRRPVAVEFLRPAEKNECMQDVAFQMESDNRAAWNIELLAQYVNRRRPDLASAEEWKRYLMDIRVYSFLDTATDHEREQIFRFSHEAFREYFLAEYLVHRLQGADLECFGEIRLSLEVARMMADILALKSASEIVNLVAMPTPVLKQVRRNLALLEITRRQRCPKWPLQDIDFSGLSLRGIDFSECQLRGAAFINCDLRNTRFDGAQLENAKFHHSRIEGALFKRTRIVASQFQGCDVLPSDMPK
jgi:hypothetical protein